MTSGSRVIINAIVTYGRTLLRMALGIFSSRWVLEALGVVDYGLMGVVGSIIVFITFFNSVFSGACSRFFAYSIGKNNIEELRKWFNSGLSVHLALGTILVVVGYPLGEWAINNFLNIPADRLVTAHWVFRFSLIAAFWTMVSTPYMAMYIATQNIVELTLWEIASILTNFGFVYWLTTYQGNTWFVYSLFTVAITVILGIGQVARASHQFPGCKLNFRYWGEWGMLKEMFSFSAWSFFGSLGYLARANVPSILLNKFFNPVRYAYVNASYQIGSSLAGYTQSMSTSLLGAFTPHITTLAGANEKSRMINSALYASKFGTLLTLFMAIPVFIEADYLLLIWLKNPPLLAAPFCRIVLLQTIFDNLTSGHMAGIMASGKIKWYQITTGMLCILSIPISWLILKLGAGPLTVSWVIAGCMMACSAARLYFGQLILDFNVSYWMRKVLYPILIISFVSFSVAFGVKCLMPSDSFISLCVVTLASIIVMSIMSWLIALDKNMKSRIINKFRGIISVFVNFYEKIRKKIFA